MQMIKDFKYSLICLAIFWAFLFSLPAQTPHGTTSEEVPRGAIDGVNASFTLNFQPAPWGSIHVYRNGMRLKRVVQSGPALLPGDYTLGGPNHMQIIFQPACLPSCIPQPTDTLLADYTY